MLPEGLLRREPEGPLGRLVPVGDDLLDVGGDDRLVDLIEHVGLERQALDRGLALADVLRRPEDALDRAVDDDGDGAHLVPAEGAVEPVAGVLVMDRRARGDDLVELLGQPRGRVVPDGELPDLAPDDLPVGVERHGPVAEEDRPVRVEHEHDVRRRLDQRPPEHALPLATVRSHRPPC